MFVPIRYGPNMRVNPQIGIFSYLSRFGHRISWVLSAEDSRVVLRPTMDKITAYVAPYVHYLSEKTLPGKAFNLAIAARRRGHLAHQLCRQNKYNMLFVRDDTYDGQVALNLKNIYKTPLIYELTDPLEQEWEGYKIEGKKPLFLWYLLAKVKAELKKRIMKQADLILITTPWFEGALVSMGIPASKLMPFPNGVNPEYFAPRDGRKVREKYHLNQSNVILYVGVIGKTRKLSMLIDTLVRVKKAHNDAYLVMVGDGTDKRNLEKLAVEMGVRENVIFTGRVPPQDVPDYIAAADICVSPIPPFKFYQVSSPIKMIEYMAMGKPVVASEEVKEQREVIEENGGGILAPFRAGSFAEAIIELIDNSDKMQDMGQKGAEWVAQNRTYEILAHKLESRLNHIVLSYWTPKQYDQP